jgi:glycosyltransferase involved in cell wall biosynthesis
MKKYKVGLWGQLGGDNPADGQAIKTIYVLRKLQEKYGSNNVTYQNTNKWRKNPIIFFFGSVKLFVRSNNIVIMPANNGLRVIAKIYNFLSLFAKRKIIYFVIGGFLPQFLDDNPHYCKYLQKYRSIFVETPSIRTDLLKRGLRTVSLIPNFKLVERVDFNFVESFSFSDKIMLCTFSRVTPSKGINEAIEAVVELNAKEGAVRYYLDIYGLVDSKYQDTFIQKINSHSEFLAYKGVVSFEDATKILPNYFALLFPTYYHGEGFAGCLIDAFFSGLPIIASDWLYNSEIVVNGVNGYLCTPRSAISIQECVKTLERDRNKYLEIRKNNYKKSFEYDPDIALKPFFDSIDL